MPTTYGDRGKSQILIVDDELANLRLLTTMLMEQGYEVRAVMNGPTAIKAIGLDAPDIILLDICMPDMDGYTVCRHLKADAQTCDIPIIFISALDEVTDKVEAFRVGGVDYITKPFQVEEVLARIENQLTIQQTRAALQQSESRYRAIVEDQTELICRFRPDYTLTFVNDAYCRYFGKSRESLINQNMLDTLSSLFREKIKQQEVSFSPATPVITTEHLITDATAKSRWVQWTTRAIFDPQGTIVELQSVGRDITERVQAEEERRKLQRAVEQSPSSVVITDTSGAIQYVNPKFTQVTGYAFEDAQGQNPRILQAGDMPKSAYKEMWNTILSGKEWHGEFHNRRKDGKLFWELASISPILNAEGVITHFVAVKEDITERKHMEEELERAWHLAEAATRAKSEFLANMSHEIRTPMNALIGMTNLLLDTNLDAEQHDYVETIRISSDALLSLINDILDFSKIEAGKLELEEQVFHLYDCVEEAIDLISPQAALKGLNLAYCIDEHIPCDLIGDMARIRQIVVNLLSNAVKFTNEGEVMVSVEHTACSIPHVAHAEHSSVLHAPCSILLSVSDTGIGIPPDRLSRLFQPFTQIDASTTRKYGGTGLGLAISRRLVEMMGGSIRVESSVGHGSTFHVTLTLRSISAAPRPFLDPHQPALSTKRVLIVSDNQTNCTLLTRHVQFWNMYPIVATTAAEALKLLDTETSIDVVLLDMQRVDTDSLMLSHHIQHNQTTHNLPLVLWTSIALRNKVSRWVTSENMVILVKPIRPASLYETLTTIFQGERRIQPKPPGHTIFDHEMGQRHPLRILLAEDNTINQKVARRLLEKLGYRADVASNGIDVLHALERQLYDVILMDVQMPEMDGVAATQHIRNHWPADRQPYVIAMTAHALQGDREWLIQAGMDDYVKKPVRIEELMAALARARRLPPSFDGPSSFGSTANSSPPLPDDTIDIMVLEDFLETMEAEMPEDVSEWMNLFLNDTSDALATLKIALDDGNVQQVFLTAHTLKGSSAQLGARGFSHYCKRLEALASQGTLEGATELLVQLEAEYNRVQQAFSLLRTTLRSSSIQR